MGDWSEKKECYGNMNPQTIELCKTCEDKPDCIMISLLSAQEKYYELQKQLAAKECLSKPTPEILAQEQIAFWREGIKLHTEEDGELQANYFFRLFRSYIKAGFTENQAFELVKCKG